NQVFYYCLFSSLNYQYTLSTDVIFMSCLFFFIDTATTEIYTLSLHDALPICPPGVWRDVLLVVEGPPRPHVAGAPPTRFHDPLTDRKSTRLNSSHVEISYAVFCLKKKKI